MPQKFVNVDRNTPMLLSPDLRDWVPENHIVHFLLDALDSVPMHTARVNHRGTGNEQYPPQMMLGVLIYGYITGRFSSREIEAATYSDVAMRYLAADLHPDHDTLCAFRRNNAALLKETFTSVLLLAKEMKVLKVGTVSVDGTKVMANASKHKAVSYKRAGEQIELIEAQVDELLKRAADADSKLLADGLSIPEEIALRKARLEKLATARAVIEARAREAAAEQEPGYQEKLAAREAKKAQGKRPGGKPPKAPDDTPKDGDQFNFTDPESRIMKAGNGKHFEQAFNAQAAVDADGSLLIVGARVTNSPNDKQQLAPTVASIPASVGVPAAVAVDNGFYSQQQIDLVEANRQTLVYAAVDKQTHHRSVSDLEAHQEPPPLDEQAAPVEKMAHRLKTAAGKAIYKLRKETVEPVFGIIKEVMGFRRFSLRGLEKVTLEWDLVAVAFNLKRLFTLKNLKAA
jgi:transposase